MVRSLTNFSIFIETLPRQRGRGKNDLASSVALWNFEHLRINRNVLLIF